jgi:hypothetical protein
MSDTALQPIDWEGLASHGHAPSAGCRLLGVGYEDAFESLRARYLESRFSRGQSAEKFIVGPFGSGKTHFLRQLMEVARDCGCVPSEVKLNRDLDFTKRLVLYVEIAREIRAPEQPDNGVAGLLRAINERVVSQFPEHLHAELAEAWITGLDSANLKLDAFARVVQTALRALRAEDDATFLAAVRWLSGDIRDRDLSKILPVGSVPVDQHNLWAARMALSLFQLVKRAGYQGTVVGLDEAEQGFALDRKHVDRILSMLKSDVDSLGDLEGGSALVVYALTPDLRERMDELPALQQRLANPGGLSFFDGNYLAPIIDLSFRQDPVAHLEGIARRLVEIYSQQQPLPAGESTSSATGRAIEIARDVAATDQTSSSRRTLVKRVCAYLLGIPEVGDSGATREF